MSYVVNITRNIISSNDETAWKELDDIYEKEDEAPGQSDDFLNLIEQLLKKFPEDEDSVWTDGPLSNNAGKDCATLGILTEYLDEVIPVLVQMANKKGFVVFDMQLGKIFRPGGPGLPIPQQTKPKPQLTKALMARKSEAFLLAATGDLGFEISARKKPGVEKSYPAIGGPSRINIWISFSGKGPGYPPYPVATIRFDEIAQKLNDHYLNGNKDIYTIAMQISKLDFPELDYPEIKSLDDLESYFSFLGPLIRNKIIPFLESKTDIKKFAPYYINYLLAQSFDSGRSSMFLAEGLAVAKYAGEPNMQKVLRKLYRKSWRTFDRKEFRKFILKQGYKVPWTLFGLF